MQRVSDERLEELRACYAYSVRYSESEVWRARWLDTIAILTAEQQRRKQEADRDK